MATTDQAKQIDELAKSHGWFRPDDDSDFYPIIQEYLAGNLDLSSASTKLFTPMDEKLSAGQTVPFLDFWYSIIHSSKRIPYRNTATHTKLISLVQAFKTRPTPPNAQNQDTYGQLADLGIASREAYNDSPGCGAGYSDADIHAWANYNYFLARVTNEDLFDHRIYALWAMREALEEPMTEAYKVDASVPAAAVWVFGMGRKLYEHEQDLTPEKPRSGNPAKGGELWTGGSVFSKERWGLWKRRFGEFSAVGELKQETREVAREAFEEMGKVEVEAGAA